MSNKEISRLDFARHLRHICDAGDSGAFTIVTSASRSVLLRLSAGQITTTHCRGRDVEIAMSALRDSDMLRYTFTRASAEKKAPLIDIDSFLRGINAYVQVGAGGVQQSRPARAQQQKVSAAGGTSLQQDLQAIAVEVLGPVAEVLVEEALANQPTVRAAIAEIASAIPNSEIAAQFIATAQARFPDIEDDG